MIRENLYESYSINFATLDVCPKPEHKHTFFELVYVRSGTGRQCINQSKFNYKAGHLFLLTPDDCHSFEVETTTEFFFLQFNDIYIKEGGLGVENIRTLEYILQNANHQPGCILRNLQDKALVNPLVDALYREYAIPDLYNQELIHQLVKTLIVLVARNIAKYLPDSISANTDGKAVDILQYIQQHIYHPEKLKAEHIGELFGVSNGYLGRYFKKHTQETMQVYIAKYKIKLIEHRLKFSDKRINEIADEFGFTDVSHLNKYFKKHKGNNLTAYRELVRA
jgi:AraC-like DNA-binding protein